MGSKQDPVLLHAHVAETACAFLTAATTATTTTNNAKKTDTTTGDNVDNVGNGGGSSGDIERFIDPAVEAAKLAARQFACFHDITSTATTSTTDSTTNLLSKTMSVGSVDTKEVSTVGVDKDEKKKG